VEDVSDSVSGSGGGCRIYHRSEIGGYHPS
jgi:hypothetical protein